MADLHGKWALITGASRGVGLHVSEGLAKLGCNLVPAYLLVDQRGEHGTIVKPAFDPEALHGLMSLLHARGAVMF